MKNKKDMKKIKAAAAISAVVLATLIVSSGPAIIADITPPQVIPEFLDNVTVVLEATDDISGVNRTMYKIDLITPQGQGEVGNWGEYTEPIFLNQLGSYTITYYSVDNAGNVEAEKSTQFKIVPLDTTPPVTNCVLVGNQKTY